MSLSQSPSQPRPTSKDPPDKVSSPLTSSYRPSIKIRTPTLPQPSQLEPQLEPQLELPSSAATPRPPFAPFFTLITNATTGTIYHPRNIHYLFSDDDLTPLTTACLASLEDRSSPSTSPNLNKPRKHIISSNSSSMSRSPSSSTNNAKSVDHGEPENRILLLDLDASGTSITKAHSLSSSWQILSTNLQPAPTWVEPPSETQGQPNSGGADAPNFMLRIAGTDGQRDRDHANVSSVRGADGKENEDKIEGEAFEALMRTFDERMKVLRTVVEAGDTHEELEPGENDGETEMLKEV